MGYFRGKLRAPPSLSGATASLTQELQSLSEWNRELWQALNALPSISCFSGTHPNLSKITGIQGDVLVNVGSASTNTVLWVLAGAGSASTTSSWRAVATIAQS